MSELLFENTLIKESLENLLALNQINKYELEIDKYAKEIRSLQAEMAEILKKENIDEEVVNRIYTYRTILSSLDDENDRLQEIDETLEINQKRIKELQDRIDETEAKLEELKTEIFETTDPERIIECQNEIENNNVRLNDLTEILDAVTGENTPLLVEKEYLSAKNDEGDFNIPSNNKQELSKDLSKTEEEFNKALEKLPLPIREEIEFCQKKIQNREIEIQKFTTKKESVINAFPEACSTNVKEAHDAINPLIKELGFGEDLTLESDEEIDEDSSETDTIEVQTNDIKEESNDNPKEDIKDEISKLSDEIEPDETETKEDTKIEEDTPQEETPITEEEPKEEVNEPKEEQTEEKVEDEKVAEDEEIGSVSYVLSDGESLMNIAEKVYPSKDNWEAIYYFNKYAIDNYLTSNGISSDFDNIKELADDTSVFTGIKLEIPTDYNYKI